MLELTLKQQNNQITVYANGNQSHQFSILDLSQTKEEWKDFLDSPRLYGEKLFNALFRDTAKIEFDAISKQTERAIVLVLESPELDGIVWEYTYNKAKEEYVVEDCAFVRALPETERPANGRLKASYERLPLLFIPANPLVDLSGEPMRALDEDSEWREITKHIIASNAGFDLLKMLPATPEQLQTVMAQFREGLIVHFSGHVAATRDGAFLLFERENGASNPLEAREFVREIKDKAAITFLSACQSAVAERTEFSNLARGLVKAGVPFALGMQFNLPDPFAPDISGQFYNYLTRGHGVPEAARQARRAVKREHEFFVGMIAVYAAHPDETGALRWSGAVAKTLSAFRLADVSDLPSPASGLIGRQRELMRIGTQLLEGKKPLTVTLHGAGGIGKTALLWQALLRFAPSFELTLAIALDPLPSLESVLGRIERFLGLPSPCANDTKEREAILRNALTSKRTLLGLDNFETLNHAVQSQETLESTKVAKSLYAFFKSLPASGVILCVTSREKTNLPGEHIEEIYGLEDAMGGALFYENVSSRKDALSEAGVEKLSAAVGGHPLALRLLAPIFEEQAGLSLKTFIEKLQMFLPKASDQWTEAERHASLGACFAFSMNNLPKNEEGEKLQVAISHLSVFASFFVDFTAAPVLENKMFENEEEFTQMRTKASSTLHKLWERGLLERATLALSDDNFYLYRFHPALGFFVKGRLINVESISESYWQSMSYFANYATELIKNDALIAQIALRLVPDLLIAAEAKSDEKAALMQNRVGSLLGHFGLYDAALNLLHKSLMTNESLSNREGKATVLHNLAFFHVARGNLDDAITLYQQSLKIKEELGDSQGTATTLHGMADIFFIRGELDKAMTVYQQSLEIFSKLGDMEGKANSLGGVARILYRRKDYQGAAKAHEEAVTIFDKLGHLSNMAKALGGLAMIDFARGNLDEALVLYQRSLKIFDELGELQSKSITLTSMGVIQIRRGDLNTAMELFQQSLVITEKMGDLFGKASALKNMGSVLFLNNQFLTALRCLIEAFTTFERVGARLEVQSVMHSLVQFRQSLGRDKFDAIWLEGIGQPLPEWLIQQPQQEQGMTAKEFIVGAIQSAREKRPEADEYFNEAQRLAADSNATKEVQELGRVIQRVMLGDGNVDLSSLPREWSEIIMKELGE